MRVNIYAEEITDRVEIVDTIADTGSRFIGVRFFLHSAERLHRDPNDDDSSAVTFWIKSNRAGYKPGDEDQMRRVLTMALNQLDALKGGG